MATLTLDLIRKKAEHHTDTLATLQELSLHQLNLDNLTPILSQACPQLRILYLHNNLLPALPTFRHLHRLKSLTYLNLTLNNITHLPAPHMAALEKLAKLDLTLNHIGAGRLVESMAALVGCEMLRELYMTGNPCMKWSGCRLWIVDRLGKLERLDGKDITRSERLEAQRDRARLTQELEQEIENEQREEKEREQQQQHFQDSKDEKDDKASDTRFTPALRVRMYQKQQAAEAKQQAEATASSSKFATPTDLYTAAKQKLNTFLNPADFSETSLPSQRNVGRYPFTMADSSSGAGGGCVVLRVELPRHMDTSSVRVDVHPWWLQVDVRGSLLVLHTGEEVEVGRVSVKRVVSDGSLVVRMPVVRKEEVVVREEKEGTVGEEQLEGSDEETEAKSEKVVVMRGKGKQSKARSGTTSGWEGKVAQSEEKQITEESATTAKDKAASTIDGMKQLSATRSVTLEAKRQKEQEAFKQRQLQTLQKAHLEVDDDDVPPLI